MIDKILAFVCSVCPLCLARRRWPDSSYGRCMSGLEKFCPFCRAYARMYSPRTERIPPENREN